LNNKGQSVEIFLQAIDASVIARRKKNKKKVACGVVIEEVTTRAGSSNFVSLEDFSVSCGWKKENEK
jgi:hypothetical protein